VRNYGASTILEVLLTNVSARRERKAESDGVEVTYVAATGCSRDEQQRRTKQRQSLGGILRRGTTVEQSR